MAITQTEPIGAWTNSREASSEALHERWAHCHVNWTAVVVGAFAAFAMVLVLGLIGIAVGAHLVGPDHRVVDLKKLGMGSLIFSVVAAFFSFVVGGWVAGKIAGILHAEPAMLHGAITFLVTVPMLVLLAGLGAASSFGGWYAGLGHTAAPSSPYVRPDLPAPGATAEEITAYRDQQAHYNLNVVKFNRDAEQWQVDTPKVTQNSALGTVTALLLGLIGAVLGGWMASGEPMNFTHYQTRKPRYHAL